MAAELEIRFTGDDPEQQAAFDNPHAAVATSAPPSQPAPAKTGTTSSGAPVVSMEELRGWLEKPPGETTQPTPSISVEELHDALRAMGNPAPPETQSAPDRPETPTQAPSDATYEPSTNCCESVGALLNEIHDILARETQIVLHDIATSLHEINMRGGEDGQRRLPAGNGGNNAGENEPPATGFRARASQLGRNLVQRASRTRIGRAAVVAGRATQAALARIGIGGATTAAAGTGTAATATAAGGAGTAAAGAGLAAALGPVGIAAGVAAVAFTGAALTVRALSNAVHGVAEDLEELSPAIASIKAQADARQTLAKLDRAERIGPEVAQLEAARYRIQESMYEVQTKILELLLKGAPFLEVMLDVANVGVKSLEVLVATSEVVAAATTATPLDDIAAMKKFGDSLTEVGKALQELADGAADPNAIDPFLSSILNLQAPPKAPPPNIGGMNP